MYVYNSYALYSLALYALLYQMSENSSKQLYLDSYKSLAGCKKTKSVKVHM